jgi:hypothetical protein
MDLADCHTAEMSAANALEEVIELGGEWLYDRYVEAKIDPMTLEWMLGQLAGLVELQFVRRDAGEAVLWEGDSEPVPNPTDSWARGRVAIKIMPRKAEETPQPAAFGQSWSRLTSRSSSLPRLERPAIYQLDWAIDPCDPELDALRVRKEQQLLLQKAENDRQKAAKMLKEENRRRMERAASDLRNSQFTYDYDGNIVLVKPRPLVGARKVQATLLAMPEPQQAKKTYVPKKPVHVIKQTPVSELQFVKSISGDAVMDVLKVGTGVTAFDLLRTKKGPERPWKTMSREDYKQMIARYSDSSDLQTEKSPTKPISLHRRILSDIPDAHREGNEPLPVIDEERIRPAEDLSAVDKFNIELFRSQDWGLNIATLGTRVLGHVPDKATPRTIYATHGNKSRHPRDRPFVDRSLMRKCLPPPAAGKTMGHGAQEPCYSPIIKHV